MISRLIPTCLLLAAATHAGPITGSFNIAGTITVTTNTITWVLNDPPFPPDKATIGPGTTGSFSLPGIAGSTVTIRDLNRTTAPVGSTFGPLPFISFDSPAAIAAGFPALNINFIFNGIFSNAACATLPPAVGQSCTPSAPGAPSPFNFVNNPPGPPDGPQATGTFVFQGVTSDGLENWRGNFTSSFNVPFQTVLAALAANGSVTQTFAATFTLSPAIVPEPITLSLVGIALSGLSLIGRRKTS
ncbi:MAG: hypothetical protein JWP63_811 [Candidatus Solibacter sp.]|jgi:hypothetical protein|nr:hypothetical protein [Candidatus Solibacter sp.]